MNKPPVTLAPLHHRGEQHIKVLIPNTENAIALIRQIPGRKWSKTHTCWYVPYTAEVYRKLKEFFEITTLTDHSGNKPPDNQALVASHDSVHAATKPPLAGERDKVPGMVGTQTLLDKKIASNVAPPPPTIPTGTAPAQPGEHEQSSPPALRLERENENRLKAFVPPQQKTWIEKIKSIPGRAWNQEGRYWSLPLTRTVVSNLREWFGEQAHFTAELPDNIPEDYRPKNWRQPQPENTAPPSPPAQDFSSELKKILPNWMLKQAASSPATQLAPAEIPGHNTGPATKNVVTAIRSQTNKHLVFLKVPAHRRDWIDFVKALPGTRWMPDEKVWSVPRTQEHFERCRGYFGEQMVVETAITNKKSEQKDIAMPAHKVVSQSTFKPYFGTIEKNGVKMKAVMGNMVIVEKLEDDRIGAFVPYDKTDWIDFIRKIPGRQWNGEQKCWTLPLTRETVGDLTGYFQDRLQMNFEVPGNIPDKYRYSDKFPGREAQVQLGTMQNLALTALEEKLLLEGKRFRTIKTYKNALAGLLVFYSNIKPSQITVKQINNYIIYKRRQQNYTRSTVNTLINALNAFYGRVLDQMDKVLALERPKKDKKLPNVLSKDEVERLLNATENEKHKCMLVLLYSAGLRKGEVLSLKVRDLNATHQCIFVRNGKGGKDRLTLYPPKAQALVKSYIAKYKPRYWLFEGQTGGQYSETSLQVIFDRARQKSGVNPDITIHGLRHSFATHLTFDGAPLHELKRLLGHENIATTEIYLHLANKFFAQVKSPLEGMKI